MSIFQDPGGGPGGEGPPGQIKPDASGNLRVNQLAIEILGVQSPPVPPPQPDLRVNQLGIDILGVVAPRPSPLRVNQLAFEILGIELSPLRVNQMGFEILGVPNLILGFSVTDDGNLHTSEDSNIAVKDTSIGSVDTGATLRMENEASLTLTGGSVAEFVDYSTMTAVGASVIALRRATLMTTTHGIVTIGASPNATTRVTLGDGTDPVNATIGGTLSLDDTSSLMLGPGGAAALTIERNASLTLINAAFTLLGTLDISGYEAELTITGYAPGDGVASNGDVIANFTWREVYVVEHEVFFTDASFEPPISAWQWDFGDGGSSNLANPNHVYAAAGTYVVTLTVASAGASSTAQQTITVT